MVKQFIIPFFFPYVFLCVILTACRPSGQDHKHALARVGEKYLYPEDLHGIVPENISARDSLKLVRAYVRDWTEKQVLIKKAELNLSAKMQNVEQKLQSYKNALLIYYYEKQLIDQMLDSLVTDSEIFAYYRENKKNFELNDYIVKVIYAKFNNNTPKLGQINKWFKNPDDQNRKNIKEYCLQYSVNYFLEDSVWLYLDDVLREVPIEIFNKEKFLKSKKFVQFEDEQYVYMLYILDYRLKNSISPLSLERDVIINNILNQRKIELIKKMKSDIFQKAFASNECEIY